VPTPWRLGKVSQQACGFFWHFLNQKKKEKKAKTQRPENFHTIDTKLLFISIFSEGNILKFDANKQNLTKIKVLQ
jgi:ADP-heptose:LPS heptosyltransferase